MRKCLVVFVTMFALLLSTTVSFAAADPAVSLVNPVPNSAVVTNNILISIKVTKPQKTIRISAFEWQKKSGDKWVAVRLSDLESFKKDSANSQKRSLMEPEKFNSGKSDLSFYTKKIEGIGPGLYQIRIETLDSAGKVIYSSEYEMVVKEKSEDEAKIFKTSKSGTSQFLQNLLSKIFKS